jgi:IS1 family transposase
VWIALDSETKLILSYYIGQRDNASAKEFIYDLSTRVAGRFQITTDALRSYIAPIENTWGDDVDFAQLVKLFGSRDITGPDWYGTTNRVIGTVPSVHSGNPDPRFISTSHIERSNLTLRMQIRRFTRLTNAFSKKLDNLRAAVALYVAWYNFCRIHLSLRVTPAMEAGLADHVWTIAELLGAA